MSTTAPRHSIPDVALPPVDVAVEVVVPLWPGLAHKEKLRLWPL